MYYPDKYLKLEGAPFNDKYMQYDYKEHTYKLLYNWVKIKIGTKVFGKLTQPEINILLDECKDNMYLYIKNQSRKGNYDVVEYRIAKDDYKNRGDYQARTDLRDAMLALLKYALRSGGDMLGDQHGMNLKKGQYIADFDKIREKLKVSSNVLDYLNSGENSLVMKAELRYDIDPDDYRVDY